MHRASSRRCRDRSRDRRSDRRPDPRRDPSPGRWASMPEAVRESEPGGRVGYVLKGYPRLSEVFITSEIYRVERLGVPVRLYVLKAADEEVHHDVVRRVRTRPEY